MDEEELEKYRAYEREKKRRARSSRGADEKSVVNENRRAAYAAVPVEVEQRP